MTEVVEALEEGPEPEEGDPVQELSDAIDRDPDPTIADVPLTPDTQED